MGMVWAFDTSKLTPRGISSNKPISPNPSQTTRDHVFKHMAACGRHSLGPPQTVPLTKDQIFQTCEPTGDILTRTTRSPNVFSLTGQLLGKVAIYMTEDSPDTFKRCIVFHLEILPGLFLHRMASYSTSKGTPSFPPSPDPLYA